MIKQFFCKDGSIYAKAEGNEVTVDELIEFLEQFRGKLFWNGASGDVAFRIEGNIVCCDSADFNIQHAYEKDDFLGEMICTFLYCSDEESVIEEEWRSTYVHDSYF